MTSFRWKLAYKMYILTLLRMYVKKVNHNFEKLQLTFF